MKRMFNRFKVISPTEQITGGDSDFKVMALPFDLNSPESFEALETGSALRHIF